MFLCTYNIKVYEELKNKLHLIQKINCDDKILYIFVFDKSIYNSYSDKEVFISNKLFFNV